MPRLAAARRRFHRIQISPSSRARRGCCPAIHASSIAAAVHVHVAHRGGHPGVAVASPGWRSGPPRRGRAARRSSAAARAGTACPTQSGRCAARGLAPARPAARRRRPARPTRRARRARRGTAGRPGRVWSSPNWPHTSSMYQRSVASGAVDQRHHPLARPGTAGALADSARAASRTRPSSHLHVGQVELAGLVDPQPDLGHQPGRRVVPRGRRELAAGRQLPAPPGEQRLDLRAPAAGSAAARPCGPRGRFISSIGHSTTRPVIACSSTLCRSSRNSKYTVNAARPRAAGCPLGAPPQHRPEVGVGIGRFHLPQRPAEPLPDLLQVAHVAADRAVRQPGRRPREHEPGQHVGLELLELVGRRDGTTRRRSRTASTANPRPSTSGEP